MPERLGGLPDGERVRLAMAYYWLMELTERIVSRVIVRPDTGCWIWPGSSSRGYGTIRVGAQTKYVHRVAYELWVESLPEDTRKWTLDHWCETPRCVNPRHLQVVTRAVNAALGSGSVVYAARKSAQTHCKNRHEYTEETTGWVRPRGKQPYRRCLVCNREAWRRWRHGMSK